LASDRHPSLIASATETLPLTFHLFCLHHLGGNVATHLRPLLGSDWDDFHRDFWAVYRAVSPDEFERLWSSLGTKYSAAAKYIDAELYPCQSPCSQWAWAWVSNIFTAGVRTTGRTRVEGENRINRMIRGPKKTFLQLFEGLNERSQDQTTKALIQIRQSSRRQHDSNLESLFVGPLRVIRDYAGPFAVQTCFKQMQDSLFYSTEVVQRPNEVESWHMLNTFNNDKAHISVKWLIQLVTKRGLSVRHLLLVKHESTGASHYIAILLNGRYICDCCMPSNLGIPCRHFFRAWIDVQNLPFHISLIRPRSVFDILCILSILSSDKIFPQMVSGSWSSP
ncbi:hypothetical protein DFH08DRAFT_718770, partial [Mycena albidolilacea]